MSLRKRHRAIQLDKTTEDRLACLARKTGRTKTYYARNAIIEHLQGLEDTYLAMERLQSGKRTYSATEVKRESGL